MANKRDDNITAGFKKIGEAEKIFLAAMDTVKEAIIIIDNQGLIKYWNKAAEDMFGYLSNEVLDKEVHNLIVPEHYLGAYRKGFKTFKKDGTGIVIGKTLELEAINKDRKEFPIELSVSTTKINGVPYAVGVIRDISERKRLEKQQAEHEEYLKAILEHLQAGIAIIDYKTHRIKDVNIMAANKIGLPKEKIIGRYCFEFICPAQRGKCPVTDQNKTIDNSERVLIDASGKQIPILKTATVTTLNDQKYIVESFVDITERKRLEKTKEELNEILTLINKILRHDVLNDLTILSNYLEIYKKTKDDETLNKAFKSIEKSVKLIRDMRELEILASAGTNLTSFNVREVVLNVIKEHECESVKFTINGNCNVLADKALYSVISNIVRNAITHGKANNICINMEEKDGMCEIRIADDGKGIPDEIKGKIFSEGYTHGKTGNTGLGLYIIQKTIERYGGDISVEDNKPKGTVFVIKLRPAIENNGKEGFDLISEQGLSSY